MNIRVDLNYPIQDGTEGVFRSPVDCSQVTGLKLYYPENGVTASKEFAFADAHGNNVGDIDHLFAENVAVKVILDVTTGMAFVQNADTNAYIESTFIKSVNGIAPDKNGNVYVSGGSGGSVEPLIVMLSEEDGKTKASHDPQEIEAHLQNGGNVYLYTNEMYIPLSYSAYDDALFALIGDDAIITAYQIAPDRTVYMWDCGLNGGGGGGSSSGGSSGSSDGTDVNVGKLAATGISGGIALLGDYYGPEMESIFDAPSKGIVLAENVEAYVALFGMGEELKVVAYDNGRALDPVIAPGYDMPTEYEFEGTKMTGVRVTINYKNGVTFEQFFDE